MAVEHTFVTTVTDDKGNKSKIKDTVLKPTDTGDEQWTEMVGNAASDVSELAFQQWKVKFQAAKRDNPDLKPEDFSYSSNGSSVAQVMYLPEAAFEDEALMGALRAQNPGVTFRMKQA